DPLALSGPTAALGGVPWHDDVEAAVQDPPPAREVVEESPVRGREARALGIVARRQRRESRGVELSRADHDLQRVCERVEQRRPTVEDRALLALALDAERERRALQHCAKGAAAQPQRISGDAFQRQEAAAAATPPD